MVVKHRTLVASCVAASLTVAAALPATAAYQASDPNPLRSDPVVRLQDVAAKGPARGKGPVMAVGWRSGSGSGQLSLAFSVDGGESFRRSNGRLRQYRVAGDGRLGLSLAVCDGKVWAGSSAYFPGDTAGNTDVLITNRNIGGGAFQAFVTKPSVDRKVRDVSIACIGNRILAIAWVEQSGGKTRARLMLRHTDLTPGTFRKIYGMGPARFRGGITAAATNKAVYVAWSKGDRRNLRFKRFDIGTGATPDVKRHRTVSVAFDDVVRPQLAAYAQRVAIAYSDRGKVHVKLSQDRGATFGEAERVIAAGTRRKQSRVHSIDVSGDRVVVEATKREKNGSRTPQRVQSTDFGGSWNTASFGHAGPRMGALQGNGSAGSLLREAWHHDASSRDTLRAQYETP